MKSIQLSTQPFSKADAIILATQVVESQIRNYENQITSADSEEDMKMKESSIKRLQTHLKTIRDEITSTDKEALISYNLLIQ